MKVYVVDRLQIAVAFQNGCYRENVTHSFKSVDKRNALSPMRMTSSSAPASPTRPPRLCDARLVALSTFYNYVRTYVKSIMCKMHYN